MPDAPKTPWTEPMPPEQFERMRRIIGAPSPIGFEAAMTRGVIEPMLQPHLPESWGIHRFRGNAGIVFDTHPGRDDLVSLLICGHADKIRLQVRRIGDDGKVWVDSDSFLAQSLIGHEVRLFTQDPKDPTRYRARTGATIEAIGAIHFAKPDLRRGDKGIKPEMLYLELHVSGEDKKAQVEALGIRPGNPILLDRPIRRGFVPRTFYGAYLDNGLGCFVATECARLLAERGTPEHVRCLFAMASHEEIGRFGSRVIAGALRPDLLIAVDVAHDYDAAPGVKERRFTPVAMGAGFTVSHGSVASAFLNGWIEEAATSRQIPVQRRVVGRDTGNDAMAAVLASVDSAAAAVGFPIRNMHTISESAHEGDVLAAIHGLLGLIEDLDQRHDGAGVRRDELSELHPRLDLE